MLPGLAHLARTVCSEAPACGGCEVRRFCRTGRAQARSGTDGSVAFLDLFCGAGGLSLGLEAHGFAPALAVDTDRAALETYAFNRPELSISAVRVGDVRHLTARDLPSVRVVVGGPPCQGYSNANKQRLDQDPRNELFREFVRCARESRATVCLLENVPGIRSRERDLAAAFVDAGFVPSVYELDTADFGYPQSRKRVFWLGLRVPNHLIVTQIHERFGEVLRERRAGVIRSFALIDAIKDLPALEPKTLRNSTSVENERWGFTIGAKHLAATPYAVLVNGARRVGPLFNHRSKFNNARDIEIYSRLSPGEGSDARIIADIMPYKRRRGIFKDKFFKLVPDRPSKTITAHMYYDCHMYVHPFQPRGLSPREAARVQGFPDDYLFLGWPNEWYRQVGNAVSPLAAWHVGRALKVILGAFERWLA